MIVQNKYFKLVLVLMNIPVNYVFPRQITSPQKVNKM